MPAIREKASLGSFPSSASDCFSAYSCAARVIYGGLLGSTRAGIGARRFSTAFATAARPLITTSLILLSAVRSGSPEEAWARKPVLSPRLFLRLLPFSSVGDIAKIVRGTLESTRFLDFFESPYYDVRSQCKESKWLRLPSHPKGRSPFLLKSGTHWASIRAIVSNSFPPRLAALPSFPPTNPFAI